MHKHRPRTLVLTALMVLTTLFGGSAAGTPTQAAPGVAPAGPSAGASTDVGCGMNFSDVHPTDYFYAHVQYLFCAGAVSGYGSQFRPFAQTTRAQLTKMISLALTWPTSYSGPAHFTDVAPSFPLYADIETATAHNIVAGYSCGGPGEPCDTQHRPYFRPYANVTRAQLAKMIVLAHAWNPLTPAQPSFSDVAPSTWYYGFVEAVAAQSVTNGYGDGTFRPFASATRAQLAKMLYNTLTPPGFDQADTESELQMQDDTAEETPQDLNPGADAGPGMGLPSSATAPQAAPASAVISGTITSTNSNGPLDGATVLAHPAGGGANVTATTDASGHYSLNVPAGTYDISAADKPALYPVTDSASNPVTVADGGTVAVNLALTEGGVIAGAVMDNTSSAVAGANEWAVPDGPPPPEGYGGSASDSQGHYRIVVPAGVVRAWAEKPSATLPRTGPVSGNPLTVTVGLTTTANFSLSPGGVIAGHITDAASHAALANSRVWARHEPLARAFGGPLTDGQGAYRIVVPGGTTYNVHAINVDGMYPRTDYPGNPIAVSTGMTVTADLSLTQGGMISGVITGADTGLPLAGARAIAHHPVSMRYWSWWSDLHGDYRVIVPAGAWNLYGRADWQGYYRTPSGSNPVTVTVGSNITVNLALQRGAIVTGQVTDAASHAPLPYSHVWANPPGPGGPNYGIPYTGWDGRYLLAIPAGVWGVYARNDRAGYPRTAYAGNYLTATLGMTYTADIAMTEGAIIHGTLSDAQTGNPIPFANVWARAPGGGLGYGWPISGDDGHYILAVPAGTWRLFARDLPLLYPRTPYPANPITVTAGANVRADWTLSKGGLLTGQITDAHTGLPLPGAMVWARAIDGDTHDVDYILNPDGTYALVVPAGDYRLRAADVPQGYPSLIYPLNPVHVTVGGTTTASWGLVRW